MNRLIDDINSLTSISKVALKDIATISEDAISHCVFEAISSKKSHCEVDIGVGILYIKYEGNEIRYRFVPSKRLEKNISHTISSQQSPIVTAVESSFKEKVEKAYKELV